MTNDLPSLDYERFWRRLQQIGLNAYESRAYLVLIGHPKFKALELAARAGVPRQKIYEVLDSLAEKGFARVVQEKTKLFSAIEPELAIANYIAGRQDRLQIELAEQSKAANELVEDLVRAHVEGQDGRGTLDYLRIISDPGQIAAQYRRMISFCATAYQEFSRPPYSMEPLDEKLFKDASRRGVVCRVLFEAASLDRDNMRQRLADYQAAGVEVRCTAHLPMKLALFDGRRGMIALLDPLVTKPTWTAVTFDHPGMSEAMQGLFEDYWGRAQNL